jgi:hypothetical protein
VEEVPQPHPQASAACGAAAGKKCVVQRQVRKKCVCRVCTSCSKLMMRGDADVLQKQTHRKGDGDHHVELQLDDIAQHGASVASRCTVTQLQALRLLAPARETSLPLLLATRHCRTARTPPTFVLQLIVRCPSGGPQLRVFFSTAFTACAKHTHPVWEVTLQLMKASWQSIQDQGFNWPILLGAPCDDF